MSLRSLSLLLTLSLLGTVNHVAAHCAEAPPLLCNHGKSMEMSQADLAKLGSVHLPTSCSAAAQPELERGVALLHSFWFDAARASFERAGEADAGCALAFWGVAMSYYHPLWTNPSTQELSAGAAAVARAQGLVTNASAARERDYIAAIGAFYKDATKLPHATRVKAYQSAMQRLTQRHPEDREAAAFYAIALLADAPASDKTFAVALRAGKIAEAVFEAQPHHPGAAHYIIHAYDYPALAKRALSAARSYAQIAPSSAHALHMPSHTFTQLGLWQESIASNLDSAAAARAYASATCMPGAWEEELHALDYLEYAYLQLGRDREAADILQHLGRVQQVTPERSRKAAYALAAIPARYAIERRSWAEAAALESRPSPFPRANALTYFARGYARAASPARRRSRGSGAVDRGARSLAPALGRRRGGGRAGRGAAPRSRRLDRARGGQARGRSPAPAPGRRARGSNGRRPCHPRPDRARSGAAGRAALLERGDARGAMTAFKTAMGSAPHRFSLLLGLVSAARLARDDKQLADASARLMEACGAGCDRPQAIAVRLASGG